MSVSIFLVRAVIEAAERAGAARADLRARLPFDWSRLDQPETRLEFEQFEQVLSAALDVTGDEALGLHMAEQIPRAPSICSPTSRRTRPHAGGVVSPRSSWGSRWTGCW